MVSQYSNHRCNHNKEIQQENRGITKMNMTKKIKVAILMLPTLALLTKPAMAVTTVTHVETLSSKGAITTSILGVPSAGGVTIGYFSTASAPLDSVIKTWTAANAVSRLLSNNWVDLRTVGSTGSMQALGDWDWPGGGNPGTAGTKIGGTYNWTFNAALGGKQLYIFAFNGGSSGYGYSSSTELAPSASAFSASSFSGSTEWAALKSDAWVFPGIDGTALELRIVDVDLTSELLVGVDGGNNVAMLAIPEPSSASLLALGVAGLVALRARRKS
jgi:hypothetical protein